MSTNNQLNIDDYFTQSIIGNELKGDLPNAENEKTLKYQNATVEREQMNQAVSWSVEVATKSQTLADPEEPQHTPTDSFSPPPTSSHPADNSVLRREPTLESASPLPAPPQKSATRETPLPQVKVGGTSKPQSQSTSSNALTPPLTSGKEPTRTQPSSSGHDWIMQNSEHNGPRQVKITVGTHEKSGFLKKSIRMDTLLFGLLGIIVSLVLIFTAYTLWLQ